jgi:CubicO group peptidase (beta-lactamase class C family)
MVLTVVLMIFTYIDCVATKNLTGEERMGLLFRVVIGIFLAASFRVLSWPQPPADAWRWIPCKTLGLFCAKFRVFGKCDDLMRKAFERGFETMEQVANGAMIAVMQGNNLVCELYGHTLNGETVDENSLQVIFSTSKVASSLAAAMLVDRGLLDYNAKIAKYWPKFGENGKENITVKELLQHRAGLAWFCDGNEETDDSVDLFSRCETNEYFDNIAAKIESSRQSFFTSNEGTIFKTG